ncbi:hypothetical protein WR25_16076 [Diploscapter pachys]|uniref:TRAF3-interacting protein 1 C-terminal domain-containing protein n=1 Tax=Diploscapter pachys TaxID=2018661 RepID=A0A2A2KIY3_9BILA|nr:hypothetical protein WR25_16076 [Diploscapter pachys]
MLIKLAENARSYSSQAKENNAPVEKKKRSSSKEKKEKEHKSKDRDKDRDKEREKDRNGEKKDRSRSHEKSDSKSSSKDKDKKEHRSRSKDKDKKDRDKDREKRKSEKKSKDKESKHEVIEDQLPNNNHIDNQLDVDSVKSPSLPSPTVTDDKDEDDLPLPPPPEERERQLRLATAGGRPQTSMGRPGTAAARPAPPKIKKKHIATIEDTPQTNKEPEAEIIGEGAPVTEEAENFLVEEDQPIEDLKEMQAESALLDESERGALVQKIVSTKQELEEGTGEVEEEPDDDMTRNIEREKITQLQAKVQEATRTAFPISRTIDYAQEDLESMMRELEKWRAEVRKNESAYQDKMANQKSEAFKLTTLLSRLDDEIREVKHQLTTTKKRIADLEERITIMIANI